MSFVRLALKPASRAQWIILTQMSSKQQIATAGAVQRIRWLLAITIVWMTVEASISPQFGEAYFNYGMVMMETCRYADAATRLVRALDLEFSPENVAESLISSEIHANQPEAAVAALRTIHKRKLQDRASLHWEVATLL